MSLTSKLIPEIAEHGCKEVMRPLDPWQTHEWERPFLFTIKGEYKRAHFCLRCKRHFVDLLKTQVRLAAFPGELDYESLAPEVTAQWLKEPCPGHELPTDVTACANRPRRG
jgi:hypothetical protein